MASRRGGPGADDVTGRTPEERWTESGVPRPGSPTERSTTGRRPTDPPVRDPGLYALTDHFRERLGQAGRYVSVPTVSDAIRRGQLRWNTTDGWRFAHVVDGVRVVVVVSDTETASPVVVTAWTELADREAAAASDRWDETDIETIRLRSDLSDADRAVPDRIRPRVVGRPFEMGHHRVRTRAGERCLVCDDCGGQFRSKAELTTRYCR